MTPADLSRLGRVLVTGATGFLGSHLAARLVAGGAEVHGTSRRSAPAAAGGLCWHQVDLSEATAAERLLAVVRPDVIFHLAGCASGSWKLDWVLPTFAGDLATTVHVLAAATRQGCCRLVLAASLEEPEAEDQTPPIPSSPYGAAKWAASTYARMFHDLYRTPVVLARVFMTYGPGQSPVKVIPHTILSLLAGRRPQLGSGVRPVDFVFIDDVIAGLEACAAAPGIEGATIDLGSGQLVTIAEVVKRIAHLMGASIAPDFGALPSRPREQVRRANVGRTQEKVGWLPETPLDEGLARTIAWLEQQPSGPTAPISRGLGGEP